MANKRVFQVQALTVNGVTVAGLSRLSIEAGYRDIIRSRPDGAVGVEDVDRSGLVFSLTIECNDVMKVNQLLASTPGTLLFYGKESGAATYHKYTTTASICVVHGADLRFAKNADATLTVRARLAVTSGTSDLKDIFLVDDAEVAGTLVYPVRLQRPHNAVYDPGAAGGGDTIAPIHLESLDMSIDANLIDDYADADIAVTACDVAGWNPLRTSFVHKDASMVGTPAPKPDITSMLMNAARGSLTVTLLGRGGGANRTLLINNLLLTNARPDFSAEYAQFNLSGESGWKNGATLYEMNSGTKLFSIT